VAMTTWDEPEAHDRQATVDELIDRYLDRVHRASEADLMDATYHAMIGWMRRLLTSVDMVMEDEGIPEAIRLRIIRAAIYGAPDETAALDRIDAHRRAAEATASRPVSLTLTKGEMPDWLREALANRPPGSYPANDALLSETFGRESQ
jgi:hypothetical protein